MGLPGRFAAWGDAVAARLAGHAASEVTYATGPSVTDLFGYEAMPSTLGEIARVLIAQRGRHVVFGARQPDGRLCDMLAAGGTRFVIVLDDPRSAAADLLTETGADAKLVVRAIANCCPAMLRCRALPGALVITAERAAADPAGSVAAIAEHFAIAVGPREIGAIARQLARPGPGRKGREASLQPHPPAVRKMIDGALLGYHHQFSEGRLQEITWTRDLFLTPDAGQTPNQPISLAGGSRAVVYGPYIQLPAGSWAAEAVFGFSPEAVGTTIQVDVFAGAQLACATVQPEAPGIYSAGLNFSLGEPGEKGVEIRFLVGRDDAAGQLALGHVVLRPSAMRHAGDAGLQESDFTRVLAI